MVRSEAKRSSARARVCADCPHLATCTGLYEPVLADLFSRDDAEVRRRLADLRGDLLDLGCGWGPIALTMATLSPAATVWAVDVNERALGLVRRNAEELGLHNVRAVTADQVPSEIRFRTIWSNPPIRVGKNELHGLLETWIPRLEASADAWLVVQRNLGSDSLQRWIAATFDDGYSVARSATARGFRVLKVRRHGAVRTAPVDIVEV